MGLRDRGYYGSIGRGHEEATRNFTGAATASNVIAADATCEHRVDRVVIAAGAGNTQVYLKVGGTATQKGPKINCPANDTVIVPVIADFGDGKAVDVYASAACDVYLDYHDVTAGK